MVWSKNLEWVALLFKGEASNLRTGMPDYEHEHMITATICEIRFINECVLHEWRID